METLLHWSSLSNFDSLLSHLAALAAGNLFSAIWEGTILAACVVVCLRMFPGLSAAARSVVWLNVFLLLVLLHGIPSLKAHTLSGGDGYGASIELNPVWSLVIAGVWVALSAIRGLQLIVSAFRLRGLAMRATVIEPGEALAGLLAIRNRRGRILRSAELCTSDEVQRPSVIGFLRPRILIPPALLERLNAVELQQVVVHEMEHLRRADDWTNLVQKLALVLFPLNPALLWVERRLCAERELACDDSVLRSNSGRKAYAVCLTRLAEYSMLRRSFSLVLGAWERQSELVRRVHRILRRPAESMGRKQTLVLTGSLIAGVVICASILARSPQLVGFAEPDFGMAQAQALPISAAGALNAKQAGASTELVKAVMPQTPRAPSLQSSFAPKPAAAPRLVQKNASLRSAKRNELPRQQAWVVMTTWTQTEIAPHMVLTVEHRVQRQAAMAQVEQREGEDEDQTQQMPVKEVQQTMPRYAAVPFANGWLIIQI
jgi:beta-lactamase regulating signal transducer with metallopeptidase domain